jgi:hypothetical protein
MAEQHVSPDRFPIKARVRRGVGVLLLAAVAGCAGRAPQPVAVVQPQDRYADCPAIFAEVQANNKKIQDLAGEEGGKVAQNIAAGVVGLFIWPVWFGMDFQGAAGKEVDALNSRQQYLATLAEERNWGAPAATPPAALAVAVTQPVVPAPSQPVAQPPTATLFAAPVPVASSLQAAAPGAQSPLPPPAAPAPSSISAASPAAPDVFSNPTAVFSDEYKNYEAAKRQYEQAQQLYQSELQGGAAGKPPQ